MRNEAQIEALRAAEAADDFRATFHRYYRPIYAFFARRGFREADCEDLTQETFLRVYRRRGALRRQESLEGWIRRIAANLWKNELRRRAAGKREGTEVELHESQALDTAPGHGAVGARQGDPAAALCSSEEVARIEAALARLPPRMRRSVLLRAQGHKYREIAVLMGLSIETVKSQIYQGRQRLLTELAGGGGG